MTRLTITEDPGEEFAFRGRNTITDSKDDGIIFYDDVTRVHVLPECESFTIQVITPDLVVEMDFADADGQRILITGASGGVGSMAVQLAKANGAFVIATASDKNEHFVRSLGADEFVDYTREKFEEVVEEVDVVYDTVGGDTLERSFQTLKRGGFLVSTVAPPSTRKAEKFGVRAGMVTVLPSAQQLGEINHLIAAGKLRTHVAMVLPLAEVRKAHQLSESGRTRGKIILQPGKSPSAERDSATGDLTRSRTCLRSRRQCLHTFSAEADGLISGERTFGLRTRM